MASGQVTLLVFEVLTGGSAAAAAATSLTGSVVWIVSGISNVANVILRQGTTVSAEWIISGGTSHTYAWTFGGMANYAGFVSTATTSLVTRTLSVAPATMGIRQVSTTLSAIVSAQASLLTSAMTLHVGAIAVPNYFDGHITKESQNRRRTWPL